MQVILDQEQQKQIQELINAGIAKAVKQATDQRPYLTRAGIAKYMGVSPDTITHWANMGMPVAVLSDGRKLYGKESITQWLKTKEVQQKKPLTAVTVKD